MEEKKKQYNYFLNRYYNGCNYVEAHPDEFEKYINKIQEFKEELNKLLEQIQSKEQVSEEEILGGFKIC